MSSNRRSIASFTLGCALTAGLAGVIGSMSSGPAAAAAEFHGKHPRLHAAVVSLKDAVAYLEEAPDEFHGHKAAALRATKEAIKEIRVAADLPED